MSYGVEAGINKEKLYAQVMPKPQTAQQAAEQAVLPKDEKSSGVSWTKKGNETVASTADVTDLAVLSMSSVDVSAAKIDPAAAVKENIDNFRQSVMAGLYDKYEEAYRREFAPDAMQSRLGSSLRNDIMSKLFLRLSPALLQGLGDNPAEKLAVIRERVVTQLKGENRSKMESCELTRARLEIYGQA